MSHIILPQSCLQQLVSSHFYAPFCYFTYDNFTAVTPNLTFHRKSVKYAALKTNTDCNIAQNMLENLMVQQGVLSHISMKCTIRTSGQQKG